MDMKLDEMSSIEGVPWSAKGLDELESHLATPAIEEPKYVGKRDMRALDFLISKHGFRRGVIHWFRYCAIRHLMFGRVDILAQEKLIKLDENGKVSGWSPRIIDVLCTEPLIVRSPERGVVFDFDRVLNLALKTEDGPRPSAPGAYLREEIRELVRQANRILGVKEFPRLLEFHMATARKLLKNPEVTKDDMLRVVRYARQRFDGGNPWSGYKNLMYLWRLTTFAELEAASRPPATLHPRQVRRNSRSMTAQLNSRKH